MLADQGGIENNFNYNYLLVQTILKMRDAQAAGSLSEYWTYFEYAIGLVISHLDFQLRGDIQRDYTILANAIYKINESSLNSETKKSYVNKVKEDFANAHRFYIMQALNRVGVVKVEDEGVIDFESVDIEAMTRIVRDSKNSVIAAAEKVEGKELKPMVEPEMVLVYHEGKMVQMPKDEYMKSKRSEDDMVMGEVSDSEIDDDVDDEQPQQSDAKEAAPEAAPSTEKYSWKKKWRGIE